MLRALAIVFAVTAVGFLVAAVVGMVTRKPSARTGGLLRALSVICFVVAVVLNIAAH